MKECRDILSHQANINCNWKAAGEQPLQNWRPTIQRCLNGNYSRWSFLSLVWFFSSHTSESRQEPCRFTCSQAMCVSKTYLCYIAMARRWQAFWAASEYRSSAVQLICQMFLEIGLAPVWSPCEVFPFLCVVLLCKSWEFGPDPSSSLEVVAICLFVCIYVKSAIMLSQ